MDANDRVARPGWAHVDQIYAQCSAIVDDDEQENVPSDSVLGTLAEMLARLFAYYDAHENVFIGELLDEWSRIDGLNGSAEDRFKRFYLDERFDRLPAYQFSVNPTTGNWNRRRPKPFEAAVETARRLRDLRILGEAIRDCGIQLEGAVLGGSASYGRFFNVTGAQAAPPPDLLRTATALPNASDLDVLIVVPNYETLPDVFRALAAIEFISPRVLETLGQRCEEYPSIRAMHEHCIFSHKIHVWSETQDELMATYGFRGEYVVSLHCFDAQDFGHMVLRDVPALDLDNGFARDLWDYRDTRVSRRDNQRAFSGVDYTEDRLLEEATNGWVAQSRICQIADGRYHPGLHQNVVLPQFDLRWQPTERMRLELLGFRWKLVDRLLKERSLRPFEVQNLSSSHTRRAVFAPHIVARLDRD